MPAEGNSICQLACSGTPETTRSGWRGALYSFNGKTRRMAFCLDRNPDLGQARFVLYGRHNRHFREINYPVEWRGTGSSAFSNCLERAARLPRAAVTRTPAWWESVVTIAPFPRCLRSGRPINDLAARCDFPCDFSGPDSC